MNSMSRFLNLRKHFLKRGSVHKMFNLNFKNFAVKSKDGSSIVDKSKKSVSGGSASESEGKREAVTQTIKVVKTESDVNVNETHDTSPVQSELSIKIIKTVPGHRPPAMEDSIAGRYSNTLFVVASEENNLFNVYEDMKYIINLYENLESFRLFADNCGLNSTQIYSFSQEVAKCGEFCATTLKFLDLLGKNKRFMFIHEIAKKYLRTYTLLTKEEKITIFSAQELTLTEKNQVSQALMANPENEGKTFIIDYQIKPEIMGGLQMYTENKFLDLSLQSRVDRIKDSVIKIL